MRIAQRLRPEPWALRPHVYRTPRRIGVQLSPGRVVARNARRARRGARLSGAGAARRRRRVRRAAVPQGRAAGRPPRDHRRRADDGQRGPAGSRQRAAGSRKQDATAGCRLPAACSHVAAARPRRRASGLPEPLPSGDAHEDARGERRRARSRSRSSTASRPASSRLPAVPVLDARQYGVGGLLDRLVGPVRARPACTSSCSVISFATRRQNNVALTELAQAFRVPVRRQQRRALRGAVGSAAVRRADMHPPSNHARCRRPPARAQRRAVPEVAGGHGAAVRRSPRRRWPERGAGRAPRVHDGRSRVPLPEVSGPRGRHRDVVPPPHHRGRRA